MSNEKHPLVKWFQDECPWTPENSPLPEHAEMNGKLAIGAWNTAIKRALSCIFIDGNPSNAIEKVGGLLYFPDNSKVTMYTLHIQVDSLPMSVVCAGNLDNIKDFVSNYQSVQKVKFTLLTWSGGDIEEQWDGDKESLTEYLEEL